MNKKEKNIYNSFVDGNRIGIRCELLEKSEKECIILLNKKGIVTNILLDKLLKIFRDECSVVDVHTGSILVRIIDQISNPKRVLIDEVANYFRNSYLQDDLVNQFLTTLIKKNIKVVDSFLNYIYLNGNEHLIFNALDIEEMKETDLIEVAKGKKYDLLLEIIKKGIKLPSKVFQLAMQERDKYICTELMEYGYKATQEDLIEATKLGRYEIIEELTNSKIIPNSEIYSIIITSNLSKYIKEKLFGFYFDLNIEINKEVIKTAVNYRFYLNKYHFEFECDKDIFHLLVILRQNPNDYNITIPKSIVKNYENMCTTGSYGMISYLLLNNYFIPTEKCLTAGYMNNLKIGNLIFEYIKLNKVKISRNGLLEIFLELSKYRPELKMIPEIYKYVMNDNEDNSLYVILEQNANLKKKIKKLEKKIKKKRIIFEPSYKEEDINMNIKIPKEFVESVKFLLKSKKPTLNNLHDGFLKYVFKNDLFSGKEIKLDYKLKKIFGEEFYTINDSHSLLFIYEKLISLNV